MYIPAYYRNENYSELLRFIKTFPFAVVASNGNEIPFITHLPVLTGQEEPGLELLTHFSRANKHGQQLKNGDDILVAFHGPHGYVSPSHYEKQQNVPTWNYVAVHAAGKVTVITDPAETYTLLESSVKYFEPAYFEQWKNLDEKYVQQMMQGITGIRISVTSLEGKFKLSQNKTENERKQIINTFDKGKSGHEQLTADYMKEQETKTKKE